MKYEYRIKTLIGISQDNWMYRGKPDFTAGKQAACHEYYYNPIKWYTIQIEYKIAFSCIHITEAIQNPRISFSFLLIIIKYIKILGIR